MPGGTMTPLASVAQQFTRPLARTILPLSQYARILGINPVHFQGAYGDNVWPLLNNVCENIWPRYSWQATDMVSHEELADVIQAAEMEIAKILNYWPAPQWFAQEIRQYPKYYRKIAVDRRGSTYYAEKNKSVETRWGKIIGGGQRAVTLIGNASIGNGRMVYSDEDGDGYFETCTLTVPTTLGDVDEIRVYHAGVNAMPEWEIRPVRSISITGGNVIIILDSWLMVDPGEQSVFPTDAGFEAINIDTIASLVTSVDVYREYNDTTATSAIFYWKPNNSISCGACLELTVDGVCPTCGLLAQTGCLHVSNPEEGFVVPVPATYDGEKWVQNAWAVSREPDMVKIYYYAGQIAQDWLQGTSPHNSLLEHTMAQNIAYLATARLERDICACGNASALAKWLREDLAFLGDDTSYLLDQELLGNPLGTKRGEIIVWNRLSKFGDRKFSAGTI